jgi:hypothetical protein
VVGESDLHCKTCGTSASQWFGPWEDEQEKFAERMDDLGSIALAGPDGTIAEIDIWRTAATLLRNHGGEEAALIAMLRAEALSEQVDIAGCNAWKMVLRAINLLDRDRPTKGEAVN